MTYLREARIRTTPLSTSIIKPRGGRSLCRIYLAVLFRSGPKNKESVDAGQAELSAPRRPGNRDRGVVLSVLDWRLHAGDTLLRGWRLSPRGTRRGIDLR
jgi:hypothetical protein